MTWRKWLLFALLTLLWAKPAAADNRFIVRSNLGASGLSAAVSTLCGVVLGCNVVLGLDGTLGQLYLITTPSTINPATFLSLLQSKESRRIDCARSCNQVKLAQRAVEAQNHVATQHHAAKRGYRRGKPAGAKVRPDNEAVIRRCGLGPQQGQ